MANIATKRIGDILVVIQGEEETTEADFDVILKAYVEAFRATDYRVRMVGIVDATISPSQRKRAQDVGWNRPTSRAVMVSRNAWARGIVTALGWLGVSVRAAPPDATTELFQDFLGMSDAELAMVYRTVAELRTQVDTKAPSADLYLNSGPPAAGL